MASMSSGERQRLNSVGSFIYHLRNLDAEQTDDSKIQYKNLFVVFEEVELYFHPEYQKGYINSLLKQIRQSNLENVKSISMLFVTHSPFILSDVIKSNILYLKDGKDARAIMKVQTFASNINELLAENSGHSIEEIESDTDRNNWMFGEEAKEYGIVDKGM